MRHRITYLHDHVQDSPNPSQITIEDEKLFVRDTVAAKEHRVTLGISELPTEVTNILLESHELHIRWQSRATYSPPSPLLSRITPGLHVFYTPRDNSSDSQLCAILKELFSEDLKCDSYPDAFSKPAVLSARFANAATQQYYSTEPANLAPLVLYLQNEACSSKSSRCQESAFSLLNADSVDIDYDAISHALVIATYWNQAPTTDGRWNDKFSRITDERIEVGLLEEQAGSMFEKGEDEDEGEGMNQISLGGWLAVVGDDEKPKPTLFTFPSRHHTASNLSYHTKFFQPTGLHPILSLQVSHNQLRSGTVPDFSSCRLHAYMTLPSYLFLDRYQFRDPLFLSSHHLVALHSISGATDLEAPDWVVPQWGSAVLLELEKPLASSDTAGSVDTRSEQVHVTIPMHLRYLSPHPDSDTRDVLVPNPLVFYACPSTIGESKLRAGNPFDRTNLGYEGLFGERTIFWHGTPAGRDAAKESQSELAQGGMLQVVKIPVIDLRGASIVEPVTMFAIFGGFAWICWVLFRPREAERKATKGRKKN